jgi:hypothetical protein
MLETFVKHPLRGENSLNFLNLRFQTICTREPNRLIKPNFWERMSGLAVRKYILSIPVEAPRKFVHALM